MMSQSSRTTRCLHLVAAVAMASLVGMGCTGPLELWAAEQEPMADVTGFWTLRGRGTRSGCTDDLYDGPFSLRLAHDIVVEQTPTLDDEVDRLQLSEDETLDGARLSLTGGVRGHRVDFTLREEQAGAPAVDLHFTGIWYPVSYTIEGDFTADGPMGCHATGDLTIMVTQEVSSTSGFPYQ